MFLVGNVSPLAVSRLTTAESDLHPMASFLYHGVAWNSNEDAVREGLMHAVVHCVQDRARLTTRVHHTNRSRLDRVESRHG